MTTPQSNSWFSGRRTKLITFASILAVGLTGAVAVGANIGILNAAGDTNVGSLSAAGDVTPTDPQVVDVYVDAPSTTATATPTVAVTPGAQEFAVDAAGTVAVANTATGLRLEVVTPSAGWTWTLVQPSATELDVTFTNGVRTLEFTATSAADGTINAHVNEPIITPAPVVPSAGTQSTHSENEYEGGGDDD